MEWILLVPPGVEVESRTSSAIKAPILVTSEQIQAVALTAVKLAEAGLEFDIGELLTARVWTPRAQELESEAAITRGDLGESITPAQLRRLADEDLPRPPEFGCVCGKYYPTMVKLREHQLACGMHQNGGTLIPAEHRVTE